MTIRSFRERLLQTVADEIGGIAVGGLACWLLFDNSFADSGLIAVLLSLANLIWAPLHNSAADLLEHRLTGRVASDRPHGWRIVHAVSIEVSACLVTVPLIMWLIGATFFEALTIDLGVTLFYVAYAYLFHLVYDALRPVVADRSSGRPYRGAMPFSSTGW